MCNEQETRSLGKAPPREIMFLVNHLSRIFHREMRKVCEENGVPMGYRSLLFHLAHHDGCSQRELAQKAGLQPSTVSITLDKMERDGYILREKSADDQRAIKLHLTEKGKNIDRLNRERIAVLDECFSSTVTLEEKELLISLLEKVIKGYYEKEGQQAPFGCVDLKEGDKADEKMV